MSKLSKYMDGKKKEQEKSYNKTPSLQNNNSTSKLSKYIESRRVDELTTAINFDTLQSDLTSLSKSIESVYNGWQTRETMDNTLSSIQSMYDRLGKYQEYQKKYGGADLSELQSGYKSILDGWEDLSKHYGKYKDADSYKVAIESAKKQATEYEGMKSADLGVVKTEIADLEGMLKTVKEYENKINGLQAMKSTWEYRSNGLKTDGGYSDKLKATEGEYKEYLKSIGYGSAKELEKALGEKRVYLNKAQRVQEAMSLSSVADINSENYDKKFDEYVEKGKALSGEKNPWYEGGYKNTVQYLRDNPDALKSYERTSDENGIIINSVLDNQIEYLAAKYMTDDEAKTYNYYMGKGDTEGADKYLKAIEETLKQRQGSAIYDEKESMLSKYAFGYTAAIDQFVQGTINLFNTKDDYIPSTGIQNASGLIREDIKYEHGTLGQVGYDLINTTSNMLPSILASAVVSTVATPVVGQIVGAGLMGASASGNAYQEMLNLGYDKGQARTYSRLVGVSEAGLQYALGGIGKLGGVSGKLSKVVSGIDNGLAKFAIRWGGSALSEGFEEAAQEVLTPLFTSIAAGYDTGAEVDWSEVVYSGLLGALSGGFLEGGDVALNSYAESSYNKGMGRNIKANERVADVFDIASNPEIASAYDTYTRYANKGINADNISDAKLGNLYSTAKADAQEVLDSKESTVEQRDAAQKTLDNLEVYAQQNVASRTGSVQNINKKVLKDYDAEAIVTLIESGLESAEDTDSHRIATELKAKIKNYDKIAEIVNKKMNGEDITSEESKVIADSKVKLSADEIANLSDANDRAIRAEESNDIATQLVEKGESEEIANLVARKMRGETLTTEEAEKVLESENALLILAENSNAENSNAQLLETAKSMGKENGALFVSLYDGETDIDAYTNAFNLAVTKAEKNFGIKELLKHKSVLSNEQVGKIYSEVTIKTAHNKRIEFQRLSEKTANLKAYKGFIDDSVIDYNNTSAKGKVNWNDLSPEKRQEVTFAKGLAQVTGMNLVFITDGEAHNINGSYSIDGNTITIDIFAEGRLTPNKLIDAFIPTMSHELTHWMENKSPVLFRKICDIVFSTLKKADGLSESERITIDIDKALAKEYKKKYEKENPGKTISLDKALKSIPDDVRKEAYNDNHRIEVARSEIVARACEDMLSRSKVGREMFNSLSKSEQKTLSDKIKDIIQNIKDWINNVLGLYESTSYEAQMLKRFDEEMDKLSALWDEMFKESVEVNQSLEKSGAYKHENVADGDVKFSEREIIGISGKSYGIGVYLDSNLLTGLTEDERKEMVKEYVVTELAGKHFIAYDNNKDAVDIGIAKKNDKIKKRSGKKRRVIEELYKKNINKTIKQEAVVLADELLKTAKFDSTSPAIHSHDWLDDNGKNDWDKWVVFIQEKNKSVWEATLHVANTTNGQKILYDIDPIKMVEGPGKSGPTTTKGSIPNPKPNVNTKFSSMDSTGRELSEGQMEYFKDSVVRDENGSLKVMYRGDSSEFTVFDRKKTNYSNLYGRGFYFTDSKAHAEQYGGSREFYLDIKNPLSPKQNAITKKQMLNFLKAIENDGEDYDLYNYGQDATAESVLNSVWGKGDFEMLQDISAGAIGDLVAAVELFNEVNGTNYDGIILPTETVTFNSEQAKLTSNLNPTKDKDIRFSMRENVEETKDLVAVHNLSSEKLLKTLKLGGLPMPSIAITKAREGYNNFGAISLVFGKDTIDPEFLRSNKVYSGDAWTPTYPQIAYKLNTKTQEKIKKKIDSLVPSNIRDDLGGLHLDSTNMEYELNRNGDMATSYRYNSAMKYAFLKDKGIDIELPTKDEPLYRYGEVSNDAVISFANKMVDGLKTVNSLLEQHSSKLMEDTELINGIASVLNEEVLSTVEKNTEAYQKMVEEPLYKPEDIDLSTVLGMLEASRKYFHTNGKIESKVDYREARTIIDEQVDMAEYESWLKELFSDVVAKEGIRNNKDLYTPSGNRRSFEALHYEHTLENVIKAMKEQGVKGIGGFGGGNIFGASTTEYRSIDDVKTDAENRMQQLPESKYDEIKKGFSDRFFELAYSLPIHKDSFSATDDAANMLIEAVSKFKTKSGMANYLRTESKGWANYSDYIVDDLIELVNDIRNMPVAYFEAKPQRAVGYDEIKAVIIPSQESYEDDLSEVKSELEKLNIPILEYEYGDNNARLNALNSLEDVRFSDRDSEGNTLTEAQAEFFKDSKVRDAKGRLLTLYHGTTANFNTFRRGDVGYHFGTKGAARGRVGYGKNAIIKEVYLNITNPIVFDEDLGSWDADYRLTKELYSRGVLSKEEAEHILFTDDKLYRRSPERANKILAETLISKGYDGIEYLNAFESKNITKSYIVFSPEQIKLTTNTNPTLDPDTRYSDRDNTSVYDIMGETERIKKENERFKAEIERLRERLKIERQVTKGNYFNENQLGAAAGHLRNISKSLISKDKLVDSLKDVYSFIAHSPELTWEDVFERCYRVAEDMIAEAKPEVEVNDYYKTILRDIRNKRISFSEMQKQEASHIFGKNWNRNFFGRVTIADGGIPVDSQWDEWASMYPDTFNADITDTDMPGELYDIINSLQDASETVAEYDTEERTRWLAREIYNQYWNVSPIRTTADKYDKQIRLLNFEHRRIMTEFREEYNSRLKEQHKADKERYKKLVADIRERKDKQIAQAKEHGREMVSKYKENAERKTRMQSITSNALSLNELLVKNSKDKHIPEIMREPVAALLQAIDFSSKRLLDKGIPTQKDISLSKSLGKVKDMMVKATNAHNELVELYGHGLDEDIAKMVDSVDDIMRKVGDNEFVLNKMTLEDLNTLDKTVKIIKYAVNKLNKFHTVNHARGIANLSQESVLHLDSLGKAKLYDGKRGAIKKTLEWGNALPYYVFKRFGSGGMKVYEALQDGWDKFAFNTKKIIDYVNESYTSKEVNEWSEDVKTFKILVPATEFELSNENYTPKYQEVQLTVPQIMSMYCLNKREQARGHLFQGGIRVADFKDKKGEIVSQTEGVVFTEKDISTILNSLTERQKTVADKLQEFMNTVCTDWGNDVSMARFGYKAFGEENYFPIQSDKNNLAVNDETEQLNSLFKLLNMAFTKSTIEKANNRIVISDIFDVFAQHTSDMAKYNALALPVLDAFKWYNYTEKESVAEGTFKTSGVKQSIEKAFGKDGQDYFTTFLKDINGQQEVSRDTLGKGFFSNAKIAAVGANLRVVLLQPTSYARASAIIDNKYLTKALVHKPKIKRAETHCGIALWKSMGYYDTNIQRGLEAQIKHADTWKDKATDWAMKGAEMADKVTWGYLWNACELETRDTRKDLKVGSKEFYDAVAKRLREVIYATQVVDSTMTRSQMMRSTDTKDKLLTAFASEPTLSYNMLQDAYMEYSLDSRRMGKKEAIKKNGKRIARIVTAYTITNALAALVESGFDALRDDDDEEMDMVAFMRLYLSNFASDMSITAKIPYVKEVHSFLKGFGSSRTDTQWMEEMTKAIKTWYKIIAEDKGKVSTAIKYSIKGVSDLSGLPFYNVYRDTMATLNKFDLFTKEDLDEMFEDFFN